jgi:hypothetical protein
MISSLTRNKFLKRIKSRTRTRERGEGEWKKEERKRKKRKKRKRKWKRKEEEEEEKEKGHANQQVAPPKYISNPSFSSDYTVPFRNSIILDPTLIDLSRRRRMWDYVFLGDCNIPKEGRRGGSVC